MDPFIFLLRSKEAAESFRGLSTRLGCPVLPDGWTDDSIVQPQPKEEEQQKLSLN